MPSKRDLMMLAAMLTAPPAFAEAPLRPLPDARVVDHRGRRRRLVTEVIGARVVAIDFVLTGCAALCHLVSANMALAEAQLRPRLGPRGAGLVSIGLDPLADTPAELARYAARFEAGPEWSFVTMPHASLDEVLRRLGGPQPGADHAPMVLVVDAAHGRLRRLAGLAGPEEIAGAVDRMLAARGAA
ncbi:SCO family protein [Falsiroseomonas sp. CW058]|uniref:SCO family protein n=1 Tax=Falsiroseomonas sp. CW058 TaxID=3388664 RepID=UPI003D314B2D